MVRFDADTLNILRLTLLSLTVAGSYCAGQETTATLVGAVTDLSGGVAANVTIRATCLATNTSRETTTDTSGNYSIPFLAACDYRITAMLDGFETQKVEHLMLEVQQSARLDF